MEDVLSSPVAVQVAGGLVAPSERRHAAEVVGSLCRSSHSARGRVVLYAHTEADGSTAASADAVLVLDEYRLLCAGSIATTMREAIDGLEARLRRQVIELRDQEHALTHFIRHEDDKTRSRSRRREPVCS